VLNQDDIHTIVYRARQFGDLDHDEVVGTLTLTARVVIDRREVSTDIATEHIRRRLWDRVYGDLEQPLSKLRRAVLLATRSSEDIEAVFAALEAIEVLLQMPRPTTIEAIRRISPPRDHT
jgi:hypothetical protein